tara:strand:+ start:7529 stop:8527 length:999 start_codon:yes stop_codon:yes gene_type:complete
MLTVGISGNTDRNNPEEPPYTNIPIREGATLLWHYHIEDTVGADAGRNYHQHNWVVEYCYSDYDLMNDMLAPAESYYNELLNWGCELEKTWINASDCFNTVEYIDDPYCEKTYHDIREEIRATFDDLTNCAWIDADLYGGYEPYILSQCPDCNCDYSCVDPCPDIPPENTSRVRNIYLIEISGNGAYSGAGPTLPGIANPSYSGYGSSTRLVWKAHAYDQFPNSSIGNNYHTIFWAVEICYNPDKAYCTLEGSDGFEDYLYTWACDAEKAWNSSSFCSVNIQSVAEADHNATYYANVLSAQEAAIAGIATAADSDVLVGPIIDDECYDEGEV